MDDLVWFFLVSFFNCILRPGRVQNFLWNINTNVPVIAQLELEHAYSDYYHDQAHNPLGL